MTEPTPRTWPEYAWPTPEQLADWLKVCTDEERLEFAHVAIDRSQHALRCFESGHSDPRPHHQPSAPKHEARKPDERTMIGRP